MSEPHEKDEGQARIDPKLLEILVCPLTKTTLQYDAAAQELISRAAGLAYPIRNGVPLMTVGSARRLDDSAAPLLDK
jgi:uncharacterized protein YbaR (Trm112 family)